MSKVFGIGFHKTATTSLAHALRHLGYTVGGPDGVHDQDIAANLERMTRERSTQFDAFQDNPWPLVYRQMDALYPDAKFILTWRAPDKWVSSQVKHFGTTVTPMRQLIYGEAKGCPEGNEDHYREVYEKHNRAVKDYFDGRDGKLLVMNFEDGDGWEAMCPFLGVDVPDVDFPRVNTARGRARGASRARRFARDTLRRLGR